MKSLFSGLLAATLTIAATFSTVSAKADDLENVKAAGELKIAMSGQYPPFNFVNEENQVVGFDASIGQAIAERVGVKGTLVTTAWHGIIAGLRPSGIYIDRQDRIYVADSESGSVEKEHAAWKRGIRVGSAKDGKLTAFIPDPVANATNTSAAEGVARKLESSHGLAKLWVGQE